MYKILPIQYKIAKKLNFLIIPSTKQFKKIDIFNLKGNYIKSIGDNGYFDYYMYLKKYGKSFAEKRKKLYYLRHQKTKFSVLLW